RPLETELSKGVLAGSGRRPVEEVGTLSPTPLFLRCHRPSSGSPSFLRSPACENAPRVFRLAHRGKGGTAGNGGRPRPRPRCRSGNGTPFVVTLGGLLFRS